MKANVLVVAITDPISNLAIAGATAQTGHGLRYAADSREAFEILAADPNDIDLLIVDLDSGSNPAVRPGRVSVFRCCAARDRAHPVRTIGRGTDRLPPRGHRLHGQAVYRGGTGGVDGRVCPSTSLITAPFLRSLGPSLSRVTRALLEPGTRSRERTPDNSGNGPCYDRPLPKTERLPIFPRRSSLTSEHSVT